jgi:DNA-binding NarL/FixJ family response regulator
VRVLVADDDRTVREAIELTERLEPDVALLDVRMPSEGGDRAARKMRTCSPRTRVVVLSAHSDRHVIGDMADAGVVGYVVKGARGAEVLRAIHDAAAGRTFLPEGSGGR